MKNYSIITTEEFQKALNDLPKATQVALSSNELADTIDQISAKYNISADSDNESIFHQMVMLYILGFIEPEELPVELNDALNIDDLELSKEIAAEVTKEAIAAIEKTKDNQIPMTPPPVSSTIPSQNFKPQTPITPPPKIEEQVKPAPAPKPVTPFIIHANEEVKSDIKVSDDRGTTRPVFYKPAFAPKDDSYATRSTPVKIEASPVPPNTPQAPKIVNYTAEPKPAEATDIKINQSQTPPKNVHPENIIDLKDLPR